MTTERNTMTDYIGVVPDGPGRCEHADCTEPGDDHGHCATHATKARVLAALREQASEAMRLVGEPSYSKYDLVNTSREFENVADWLDDNWDEVTA